MLARWQFASTTVYHFLIVPLSIGLTLLVAVMQTLAYRARHAAPAAATAVGGDPDGSDGAAAAPVGPVASATADTWDRASRFWGRIMLVLFALGIVTGIVQEFQFGMNWSAYSRFVGDIFGAPLAMEGLIAFFLESTFLGLWIFGRDLLSPRLHLATIWLAAIGTVISAYFILAANSFMQHPVGLVYSAEHRRVELTSIWKVLTNSTQLLTFPHVVFAAILTAGGILLSVSAWHLRKDGDAADPVHRKVAGLALGVVLFGAVSSSLVGHAQGQLMTEQQPMKMAAAEALWDSKDHASFSLFAYGDVEKGRNKIDIAIPDGLSILATNRPGGYVAGVNDIQQAEEAKYGPGSYIPVVWLAYWTFRLMIGFGALAGLLAAAVVVQWRRGRLTSSRRLLRIATWTVVLPLAANSAGWIFTETARQPWLVYGLLRTKDGISTNVGSGMVLTTLVGFTLLYGVLGVICFTLVRRIARTGPDPAAPAVADGPRDPDGPADESDDSQLSLV
ncbi:cytochrome bd-I ubiquinol oxidase subunit 1 apoprotein [Jatrophihabitans endophyticus]|uniref:Cytochrome bd-I ubiquinol oxidase subunit 1 apoprotein n=2 Tax=Jatrophihabitans endophyticus TaxID=1206085 RepID=A0A1M5CJ64_9ACTN|nr:cytochrome bd-I ubiquinol oxidase subunit 1 apoprotein [Jatrophihabitans endophyticus]